MRDTSEIRPQVWLDSGESHGRPCAGDIDKERERTWGEDELVKVDLVRDRLGWGGELQAVQELQPFCEDGAKDRACTKEASASALSMRGMLSAASGIGGLSGDVGRAASANANTNAPP